MALSGFDYAGATPADAVVTPMTSNARHEAAQAAGMRALTVCTGYYATEAPRALVDATVTETIYSAGPSDARVDIDEHAKTVAVYYLDDMPPRIAFARPIIGCTLLPVGADSSMATTLRRPTISPPQNLDARSWPMGDLRANAHVLPERQKAIDALLDEAFKDDGSVYGGITWGLLLIEHGKIVAERYQHGFGPHIAARTNSMCKGIAASLIGIGVREGILDLHREAPLSEWRRFGDPRGRITLDDLMHMASGLHTEEAGDRDIYASGAPVAEAAALHVVDALPGSTFVYASQDTMLLMRALRESVNDDPAFLAYPYEKLLWRIGMTRTIIETDWNDDFLASGQCWSTARDFGRLGLLYLADGTWNGERILPEHWSHYVSTPAPAQPGPGSIGGGAGYGAQFWLHDGLQGLPAAYAAFGAKGQYAMIIPSKGIVLVRRGFDNRTAFHISQFASDVIRALAQ